jgi:hypothetical protein
MEELEPILVLLSQKVAQSLASEEVERAEAEEGRL